MPTPTAIVLLLFGIEALRVLVTTSLGVLHDRFGWPTSTLGLPFLGVAAIGLLAIPLGRRLGRRALARRAAGGALAIRGGMQLWTGDALGEALLAAAFVAVLPWSLSSLGSRFPKVLLAGLAADVLLTAGTATFDPTWDSGPLTTAGVLALVGAAAAFLVAGSRRSAQRAEGDPDAGSPPDESEGDPTSWCPPSAPVLGPALGLGTALALHLIALGNPAAVAARSGLPLLVASVVCTLGQVVALGIGPRLAARFRGRGDRLVVLGCGVAVSSAGLSALWSPARAIASLFVLQTALAVLVARTCTLPPDGGGETPGRSDRGSRQGTGGRAVSAVVGGVLLTCVLVFFHFASYDLSLAGARPLLPILAGVGLFRTALAKPREALPPDRSAVALALVTVGSVSVLLGFSSAGGTSPDPSRVDRAPESVRVMTWNLHGGVAPSGRVDLDAFVEVLEEERPDLLALQEISRGWTVFGGHDVLDPLARRTGLDCVFGPTAGDLWGNAICSRLPILSHETGSLPPDLPLDRGWISVDVEVGGRPLTFVSTHLHHPAEGGAVREVQVEALGQTWLRPRGTILAGDFNARPGRPEIEAIAAFGFRDVVASAGLRGAAGWTSPAEDPVQQIDYVWLSDDLEAKDVVVRREAASDHRAIVATVSFPGLPRSSEPPRSP